MTTPVYLRDVVLPAASALLPAKMDTPAARALLIAIALQESQCIARRQYRNGPARGFWQFETAGVAGVLTHAASKERLYAVLLTLNYPPAVSALHEAIEHHDILAAVCARLLLWTDPRPIPALGEVEASFQMYLRTWRPRDWLTGGSHPADWTANYASGLALVEA